MTIPIGFIGLGSMGGPMTRNLIAGGYKLVVRDRKDGAMAPLVTLGAEAARPLLLQAQRKFKVGQPAPQGA